MLNIYIYLKVITVNINSESKRNKSDSPLSESPIINLNLLIPWSA